VVSLSWQLIKAVTAGCRLADLCTGEQRSPLYLICRLRSLIRGLHTVNIDKLLPTHSNWMVEKKQLGLVRCAGWHSVCKDSRLHQFKTILSLAFLSLFFFFFTALTHACKECCTAHPPAVYILSHWKLSVTFTPGRSKWEICVCACQLPRAVTGMKGCVEWRERDGNEGKGLKHICGYLWLNVLIAVSYHGCGCVEGWRIRKLLRCNNVCFNQRPVRFLSLKHNLNLNQQWYHYPEMCSPLSHSKGLWSSFC